MAHFDRFGTHRAHPLRRLVGGGLLLEPARADADRACHLGRHRLGFRGVLGFLQITAFCGKSLFLVRHRSSRGRIVGRRRLRTCDGLFAPVQRYEVPVAELMGPLVRALRELHVDVAEIGEHHGVRSQFQRRDEGFARIVEPAQPGIEHGKIVVRLEHRRMIVSKGLEYGDRLGEASFARQQDTVKKLNIRRVGLLFEHRFEGLARFRITFLGYQG